MGEEKKTHGTDFFEEVREKVDREMFQSSRRGKMDEVSGSGIPEEEQTPESADHLDLEVVVDVVDPDSLDGELDDTFLEEVDLIPPEEEVADNWWYSRSPVDEAEKENEADLSWEEPGEGGNEPPDIPEDDRYLGELIGHESDTSGVGESQDEIPPVAAEDGDFFATRTLGDLYAKQGEYEKAGEIYERLLQQTPDDPELQSTVEEMKHQEEAVKASEDLEDTTCFEAGSGSPEDPRTLMIDRLENWLTRIQVEKERRCSKSF